MLWKTGREDVKVIRQTVLYTNGSNWNVGSPMVEGSAWRTISDDNVVDETLISIGGQQTELTIRKRYGIFTCAQKLTRGCASLIYSFIHSFFWKQGSSLLMTPVLRPCSGPVRSPRKRKGIGRCVRCVLATCREGRLSRSEHLVRYFYSAPLLDMAYFVA